MLTGLEDVGWKPTEKLRARKIYAGKDSPFLPKNKSVDASTLIHQALASQTRTAGYDELDLGHRTVQARTESECSPYHDGTGPLRPRVLSCLIW